MKRVCYFCASYLGEKGNNMEEVFYVICDLCAEKLRIDERLPELIEAIVSSRKQNAKWQQYQTLEEGVMVV